MSNEGVYMDFIIRTAEQRDFKRIVELNESLVHFLSPMDLDRLSILDQSSDLHKVVEVDEKVVAFLLAFRENTDYDSVNYQWFNETYDQFLYIDRIVVDTEYHHLGIGKQLYDFISEYAKANQIHRVTAEIDIKPENPVSLAFHKKNGFVEVGQQQIYGGKKVVSLQCKTIE